MRTGAATRRRFGSIGTAPKEIPILFGWGFLLEAPPGIGPGMKVLQTSALPLGYGAVFLSKNRTLKYSVI